MALTISRRHAILAFILFDVLLAAFLTYLFLLREDLAEFDRLSDLGGAILVESRFIPDFELIDEHGAQADASLFDERWSLVFFGFTECPDICPLTMEQLGRLFADPAYEEVTKDLQVVLVSVDPLRDTPTALADYLDQFNTDFRGLTGDYAAINRLADTLYAVHERLAEGQEHTSHGDMPTDQYLINHTSHISIVTPEGKVHAVLKPPHRAGDIGEALSMILR